MSDRQTLAEHGTAFCLTVLGIATGTATVLVPLAVLTTVGMEHWGACDAATLRKAKTAAFNALKQSRDVSQTDINMATALLRDNRHKITFDPARLTIAVQSGNLPQVLADDVFGTEGLKNHTQGTRTAVTVTLVAAFNAFRGTNAHQGAFTQAMVMALLEMQTRANTDLLASQARIEASVQALSQQFAYTTQATAARASGITNDALIDLARRIAADVADPAAAFRELENAVEVAIRVQAEGRQGSNLGDFVDEVLRRVAALAAQNQYDTAAQEIDAALGQEQADSTARRIRLLDAGIAQDILRRDASSIARRLVEKVKLELTAHQTLFYNLRLIFIDWSQRGKEEGLNFDLEVAVELCRHMESGASTQDQRGAALTNLGTALTTLGDREAGTERLEAAVIAYNAALTEYTQDRVPMDWAKAQMGLGNALSTLGQREAGTVRLEQAVDAYRAALKERTQDRVPLDWAITQMGLGNALWSLGEREAGSARLEQALDAYRAALTEYTQDRVPLEWAGAQVGLGNALWSLGHREAGTARLEQAVAACRAALTENTQDRVPLEWAMTQNNLGVTLQTLGEREVGTARLEQAVTAYRAALSEFRQDRVPLDWAMTQTNLGAALSALGERDAGTARLEQAVFAYRVALSENRQDRVPMWWANTLGNEGMALLTLAGRTGDPAQARQALEQLTLAEATLRSGGHIPGADEFAERIPAAQALVDRLSGGQP
jgi:tetratricopeptide (TPR) repeat protein